VRQAFKFEFFFLATKSRWDNKKYMILWAHTIWFQWVPVICSCLVIWFDSTSISFSNSSRVRCSIGYTVLCELKWWHNASYKNGTKNEQEQHKLTQHLHTITFICFYFNQNQTIIMLSYKLVHLSEHCSLQQYKIECFPVYLFFCQSLLVDWKHGKNNNISIIFDFVFPML
jgi:hypothetical protein